MAVVNAQKETPSRELICTAPVLSSANTQGLMGRSSRIRSYLKRHKVRSISLVFWSALIGLASGQSFCGLGIFAAFPIYWAMARSRIEAYLVALAFYLVSARCVVTGAPVFFGDAGFFKLSGLLLWLATSFSLALPWGLLRTDKGSWKSKALRLAAIFVLLALPPLGMWGWSDPFLATGYLLPGFGFLGMFLLFAFWVVNLASCRSSLRVCSLLLVSALSLFSDLCVPIPCPRDEWFSAMTSYGRLYSGSDETIGIVERHKTLRDQMDETSAKYVVLPETVAGAWSPLTESLWQSETEAFARDGRTYFVGAEIWETATRYRNVVQIRGANNATLMQRYPVPIAMWRPWMDGGAVSDITGSGVVEVDGKRVGILICYEPYLFTPCFLTMLHRPDVLVVPSNSWWSRETSLPTYSDQCVRSWSLLFGVPAVISKNM